MVRIRQTQAATTTRYATRLEVTEDSIVDSNPPSTTIAKKLRRYLQRTFSGKSLNGMKSLHTPEMITNIIPVSVPTSTEANDARTTRTHINCVQSVHDQSNMATRTGTGTAFYNDVEIYEYTIPNNVPAHPMIRPNDSSTKTQLSYLRTIEANQRSPTPTIPATTSVSLLEKKSVQNELAPKHVAPSIVDDLFQELKMPQLGIVTEDLIALQEWKMKYYEDARQKRTTADAQWDATHHHKPMNYQNISCNDDEKYSKKSYGMDTNENVFSSKSLRNRTKSSRKGDVTRSDAFHQQEYSPRSMQNFYQHRKAPAPTHIPFQEYDGPASFCSESIVQIPTIELMNGVHLRFLGAHETCKSIADDSFIPCYCPICEKTLYCMPDVDSFVCPMCLVINPALNSTGNMPSTIISNTISHSRTTTTPSSPMANSDEKSSSDQSYDGVVGLGFTFEDLIEVRQTMTKM